MSCDATPIARKFSTILGGLLAALNLLSPAAAAVNLAKDRPYSLTPPPNYRLTSDDGDAHDLTDGKITTGQLWRNRGAVGWDDLGPVFIDIDLGRQTAIAGASVSTAFGSAEVEPPEAIWLLVSSNGSAWEAVGDLVRGSLSRPFRDRPVAYRRQVFSVDGWRSQGRFVRLVIIPKGPYSFADEIEVFGGSAPGDSKSSKPGLRTREEILIHLGHARRVLDDAERFRAQLPSTDGATLARLDMLARKALHEEGEERSVNRPAALPVSEEHAVLLRLQAARWRTRLDHPFRAWVSTSPYESPPLVTAEPIPSGAIQSSAITVLPGERRSLAISLLNTASVSLPVHVRTNGANDGVNAIVRPVAWTDTATGDPIASALSEPLLSGQALQVMPGLVTQLWVSLEVDDETPAGERVVTIRLEPEGLEAEVLHVHVRIPPVHVPPAATLVVGGFDYTDCAPRYGVTEHNREQLIRVLREHGVSATWATRAVLPFGRYDDEHRLVDAPLTRCFDDWVERWPGATRYYVYVEAGERVAGLPLAARGVDQRVAAWAKFWIEHARRLGLRDEQLALLLVDEPRKGDDDRRFARLAEPIVRVAPTLALWENPIADAPQRALPQVWKLTTILSPPEKHWRRLGPLLQVRRGAGGVRLGITIARAEPLQLDAVRAFRFPAWQSFALGAEEIQYWSFADEGRASAWNPYLRTRTSYTPVLLAPHEAGPTKHLAALREGLDDHRLLTHLRNLARTERLSATADVSAVRVLLEQRIPDVVATAAPIFDRDPALPERLDSLRAEAIRLAERLAAATR